MKIARIETFYVPPRWLFVRVEADDGHHRRLPLAPGDRGAGQLGGQHVHQGAGHRRVLVQCRVERVGRGDVFGCRVRVRPTSTGMS